MKTKYAEEKSKYSNLLHTAIDNSLSFWTRDQAIKEMKKLETQMKKNNDEIIIVVSTKNTFKGKFAPSMILEVPEI